MSTATDPDPRSITRDAAPYVRPTFVMAHLVNPILARLSGIPCSSCGVGPAGIPSGSGLGPFEFDGMRYLVSRGGETHWVRNLRAAGADQLRVNGTTTAFRAVELVGADRDRVVAAYRSKQGRTVAPFFRALPEASDHPVFRVEPSDEPGSPGRPPAVTT